MIGDYFRRLTNLHSHGNANEGLAHHTSFYKSISLKNNEQPIAQFIRLDTKSNEVKQKSFKAVQGQGQMRFPRSFEARWVKKINIFMFFHKLLGIRNMMQNLIY